MTVEALGSREASVATLRPCASAHPVMSSESAKYRQDFLSFTRSTIECPTDERHHPQPSREDDRPFRGGRPATGRARDFRRLTAIPGPVHGVRAPATAG